MPHVSDSFVGARKSFAALHLSYRRGQKWYQRSLASGRVLLERKAPASTSGSETRSPHVSSEWASDPCELAGGPRTVGWMASEIAE